MPKKIIGPFPELSKFKDVVWGEESEEGLLDKMSVLHATLEYAGCKCNGEVSGQVRDSDWGADISELVMRCLPHTRIRKAPDGTDETKQVGIDLSTLRAEIDSNNEICCWLYEED